MPIWKSPPARKQSRMSLHIKLVIYVHYVKMEIMPSHPAHGGGESYCRADPTEERAGIVKEINQLLRTGAWLLNGSASRAVRLDLLSAARRLPQGFMAERRGWSRSGLRP